MNLTQFPVRLVALSALAAYAPSLHAEPVVHADGGPDSASPPGVAVRVLPNSGRASAVAVHGAPHAVVLLVAGELAPARDGRDGAGSFGAVPALDVEPALLLTVLLDERGRARLELPRGAELDGVGVQAITGGPLPAVGSTTGAGPARISAVAPLATNAPRGRGAVPYGVLVIPSGAAASSAFAASLGEPTPTASYVSYGPPPFPGFADVSELGGFYVVYLVGVDDDFATVDLEVPSPDMAPNFVPPLHASLDYDEETAPGLAFGDTIPMVSDPQTTSTAVALEIQIEVPEGEDPTFRLVQDGAEPESFLYEVRLSDLDVGELPADGRISVIFDLAALPVPGGSPLDLQRTVLREQAIDFVVEDARVDCALAIHHCVTAS